MHRVVLSCIAAAVLLLALLASVQMRSPAASAIASGDSQLAPAAVAAPAAQTFHVNLSPSALQAKVAMPAWPRQYTVHRGDSLSSIARKSYGDDRKWTNIFWANKTRIHWANIILTGWVLNLPAPGPAKVAPRQLGPIVAPPVRAALPVRGSDGAASSAITYSAPTYGSVNPNDYSGFQRCVISRESGGNSQVMNSSGHYGLYQFSASTWQAYGGSAADFGHASPAEQTRVFDTAMAQGGQSNWSPYDGC